MDNKTYAERVLLNGQKCESVIQIPMSESMKLNVKKYFDWKARRKELYAQNSHLTLENNFVRKKTSISNCISGTDIGAILGFNPYMTTYDVWLKRKYGLTKPSDNKYTEWGIRLERMIAEKYCENHTCKKRKGRQILDGNYSGTPDFTITLDDIEIQKKILKDVEYLLKPSAKHKIIKTKWGLEIKTASTCWTEVPKHYELQCRWYMMLTGLPRWDLAVLSNGKDYKEFTFNRDLKIEAQMKADADDFIKRYLLGDEEPFNPECKQIGGDWINDPNMETVIDTLNRDKQEMTNLEYKVKQGEDAIKERLGSTRGLKAGKYSATWSTQTRTSCDYAKMIEDYNIDVEKYKNKVSEFRVLRIKEEQ